MGQLEIQDGFAPYFDPQKEIEVKHAEAKHPAPPRRAKPAAGRVPIARGPEPQAATKPGAGSHQMK